MTTPLPLLAALLVQPAAAPAPRAGEVYEIRKEYEGTMEPGMTAMG